VHSDRYIPSGVFFAYGQVKFHKISAAFRTRNQAFKQGVPFYAGRPKGRSAEHLWLARLIPINETKADVINACTTIEGCCIF
ncbi:MAG: hypothetical protein JW849_03710, partial [Phycisphaerae bacterium]|nr:hypothetical protein [Phycisphaerae bacterium]